MSGIEKRRVTIVHHRGQEIVQLDHRGMKPHEFPVVLAEHLEVLRERPGRRPVLVIIEPRSARVDAELLDHLRPFGKACLELAPAVALVGLQASGRLVFLAVTTATRTPARPFDDVPRALDWLADRVA